jgi:hypothetical protein
MKIRSVGAKSLHADGQTIIELAVTFRNFANVPKVVLLHVMKPCRGSRSRDRPVLKTRHSDGSQQSVTRPVYFTPSTK